MRADEIAFKGRTFGLAPALHVLPVHGQALPVRLGLVGIKPINSHACSSRPPIGLARHLTPNAGIHEQKFLVGTFWGYLKHKQ